MHRTASRDRGTALARHRAGPMQWRKSVGTSIADRGDTPIGLTKEHHWLAQQSTREQRAMCDLRTPSSNVPGILEESHFGVLQSVNIVPLCEPASVRCFGRGYRRTAGAWTLANKPTAPIDVTTTATPGSDSRTSTSVPPRSDRSPRRSSASRASPPALARFDQGTPARPKAKVCVEIITAGNQTTATA